MVTFTCPKVSFSYISFFLASGRIRIIARRMLGWRKSTNADSALKKSSQARVREDSQMRQRPIDSS